MEAKPEAFGRCFSETIHAGTATLTDNLIVAQSITRFLTCVDKSDDGVQFLTQQRGYIESHGCPMIATVGYSSSAYKSVSAYHEIGQ